MSTQGYHDTLVHDPYPFHKVGNQGRAQAKDGRRGGQGGRGYYRPHEEAPKIRSIGLDKIKWKVLSIKDGNDFQDDIVDKEESNEDQEIDSYEAIQEGLSLVTIRALSTQVLEEERKRETRGEQKKKSVEEGKGVERKVSVEKPREEKLNRHKKMSDQKSDSGKREKRCFYAKESEIIEAIEKEKMILLLYCKVKIIEEYKDVFPNEIPGGLPPLRKIEHQIDLVPGVDYQNKLAHRSSLKETKELRRQVEDFLSKGMREGDEWKTTFKMNSGIYEWLVMPFGLTNAPSTFMRLMHHVLRHFIGKFFVVYFDMLIYSKTYEDHLHHLK
ncbi:hypothetical protein M9H77_29432 [Catharanthus roseus]|uniref:Uncharacterized protein n=1 Tax=Catharanthus roseus TaxID=4058 RepID=A0ACB9ZVF5_CATRO|nr:hypothetical protein M9H77_29432 [Catharanthus roseus]